MLTVDYLWGVGHIQDIAFPWGSNYFRRVPLCGTGNLTTFIHGMKIGPMKNGPSAKSWRLTILDLEMISRSEL